MTSSSSILRAAVGVAIGVALVTGWLQPIYEHLVVRKAVFAPEWWFPLQFLSLLGLAVVAFALRRRDRKLCFIALLAFGVGVLGSITQALFGYHWIVA